MRKKARIDLRQVRDFGESLADSTGFLRQNLKPLMKALLYIGTPIILAGAIAMGGLGILAVRLEMGDSLNFLGAGSILSMLLAFFVIILGTLILMATVYEYMILYEERKGEEKIEVADVRKSVFDHLPTYLITSFLLWLTLMIIAPLSFLLFFIPLIYIAIAISPIFVIRRVEGVGFVEAIKRCFYLIQDQWWTTFGTLIVVTIIMLLISYSFQIPLSIFLMFFGVLSLTTTWVISVMAVSYSFLFILNLFMSTFFYIVIVLRYYSTVEYHDGVGAMRKIELIGSEATKERDGWDFLEQY